MTLNQLAHQAQGPGSPFIPGTNLQFAWDSVSLGWFRECPTKYRYHMIRRYIGKGEEVHLNFGIWYQSAMETFDKLLSEKVDYEEALRATVYQALKNTWVDGAPWESGNSKKNRYNLIRSIIWKLDHYHPDPIQTLILPGGKPAVELSFKFELGIRVSGIEFLYCGHLDRVGTFQGLSYVIDNKTTGGSLGPNYFAQFNPDTQMSGYTLAGHIVLAIPVQGVIIDAASVLITQTDFMRDITYRPPEVLTEWLENLSLDFENAARYAERNRWPMNDKSCHKYNGCTFRGVCSLSPLVRQRFLETNYHLHEWNPLTPR